MLSIIMKRHNIIIGIIIITVILMFIDSALFNDKKSPVTYIKNSVLNGFLAGCILYISNEDFSQNKIINNQHSDITMQKYISNDSIPPGEIILTGDPTA